ncbi:hypothetical protein ACFWD7_04725 [Streptomyces mirabilis]|uniref:hypothetical protein n=1 Tax=Streptomyces mirabilis TaxID=68239 RepID=UPI0036742B5D
MKSEEVTAVGAPIRSHISDYAETGPAEPSAEAGSSALEPRPSNPEPRRSRLLDYAEAKPPVRPDAEGRQTRQAKRDHNRRAPGLVAAGRGLVILAAPVMPAFAAYIVGWLVAWLTVREYPSEVGARRWLQEHGSSA